jgi:hypothetical protein
LENDLKFAFDHRAVVEVHALPEILELLCGDTRHEGVSFAVFADPYDRKNRILFVTEKALTALREQKMSDRWPFEKTR